jgi:hypothetical protein
MNEPGRDGTTVTYQATEPDVTSTAKEMMDLQEQCQNDAAGRAEEWMPEPSWVNYKAVFDAHEANVTLRHNTEMSLRQARTPSEKWLQNALRTIGPRDDRTEMMLFFQRLYLQLSSSQSKYNHLSGSNRSVAPHPRRAYQQWRCLLYEFQLAIRKRARRRAPIDQKHMRFLREKEKLQQENPRLYARSDMRPPVFPSCLRIEVRPEDSDEDEEAAYRRMKVAHFTLPRSLQADKLPRVCRRDLDRLLFLRLKG